MKPCRLFTLFTLFALLAVPLLTQAAPSRRVPALKVDPTDRPLLVRKDLLLRDTMRAKEPFLARARLALNLTVGRAPRATVVTALIRNDGPSVVFSVPYAVFQKRGGDWVEVKRGTISGIHPGQQAQVAFGLPRSALAMSFKLEAGQKDARQNVVIHVDAEGYL